MGLLVWITFLPLLGAIGLLAVPRERTDLLRFVTLAVSGVVLILGLVLWFTFDEGVVLVSPDPMVRVIDPTEVIINVPMEIPEILGMGSFAPPDSAAEKSSS